MAYSSLGSLESIMTNGHPAYSGGHHEKDRTNLQSIKSHYDLVADDEDMEEPMSVLDLAQCISPPLQHDVWALQQQQRAADLLAFEQQQIQIQQMFHQQQIFQWQQRELWEKQQWEKQQAELQYSQMADRQNLSNIPAGGLENTYVADHPHMLPASWDVPYDPYHQANTGVDDAMIMQSIASDPWMEFQQENAFGAQLMQGLPCLEDPLILESWMTSCSGDSTLSSASTEVDSSFSQSFMMQDEHESLSRSLSNSPTPQQQQQQQQQQQHVNLMNRCPSSASVGPVHEVSELADIPIDDQCDMQLAMDNFNTTCSPLEDIKPSSNWFQQDTVGPPFQQLPPSPMASSDSYQHNQSHMNRNPGFSKFQMQPSSTLDCVTHQFPNKSNFMSAQLAAPTSELKPALRTPENSRPKSMIAPTAAVEAVNKPGARLWGPVRPSSHALGAAVETMYPRPASESNMARRRSENSVNHKQDGNGHMGGQKNGSNDQNARGGHNTSGAGRVVTLAELASGGVKMGGVQLPTVGTQIPSVVRLAVETQASGMGGVRMVQVLLACAEAVACRDSRQANILLQQLQHMASPYGDAMQRITACFVEGLSARLAITGSQPFKFTNPPRKPPSNVEKREGFGLVYQSSPYVAFGHFAANSAILEAFEGEERMHIVDLGMTHALQWPYLIDGLAKRPSGPPKLLRITGFGQSLQSMKEAGEELSRVAAEANVPFEFQAVTGPLEELHKTKLELREGEALAVNSVLQLHCVVKESRGSLNSVLQSIHELSPKILTLVEQDASHNGPFFLGRFMEALHYYSAIFDSLDAILPRSSDQRVKMEQFHFAEEIKNIVSCEGPARVERHERVDQWRRRMSRAGFQPLPLKFLSQARLWLGLYSCEGYTLSEEKGCLVLGWKGKPIIAASSWKR